MLFDDELHDLIVVQSFDFGLFFCSDIVSSIFEVPSFPLTLQLEFATPELIPKFTIEHSELMLSKLGFLSAAAGVKTGFLDHNKSFFHVSSQLFYCHFFHISG